MSLCKAKEVRKEVGTSEIFDENLRCLHLSFLSMPGTSEMKTSGTHRSVADVEATSNSSGRPAVTARARHLSNAAEKDKAVNRRLYDSMIRGRIFTERDTSRIGAGGDSALCRMAGRCLRSLVTLTT